MALTEGILCQAPSETFAGRVYFCRRGRRHYVPSPAHVQALGAKWPDDVRTVDEAVLRAFAQGAPVSSIRRGDAVVQSSIRSSLIMREYLAAPLQGTGVEFGAGAAPFPAPWDCRVLYADLFSYEHLLAHLYPGQSSVDLIAPDLITSIDEWRGVADESLDFVIACHVIEHSENPIGAIESAWKKLRKGGYLLLVVPDRERTFDKKRPLTPLSHLLEDYAAPCRERDYHHYAEFYRLAFETPESARKSVVDAAFEARADIHYHVWDHDSFMTMIDHISRFIAPWTEIESVPTLADPVHDIEFYVRLRK